MSNWTKDDWENLVAGIIGVVLVLLFIIGFALLLAALFGTTGCAELYGLEECGDPPDSNAI